MMSVRAILRAQSALKGKTVRRDGLSFLYVLIETRVGHRVSKGEFRGLRAATQGAALRTRKPFEKGLSESFNYGCGAGRFAFLFPDFLLYYKKNASAEDNA